MPSLKIKQYGKRIHTNRLVDRLHFGKVILFRYGQSDKKTIVALPYDFRGSYFEAVNITDLSDIEKMFLVNKLNNVDFSDKAKAQKDVVGIVKTIFANPSFVSNTAKFYYEACQEPFITLHPDDHRAAIVAKETSVEKQFF